MKDDPVEQAFTYEVRALGANLKGAKMNPKEEEEGSKADDGLSAKDAKKAPPPKGKQAAAEPEELTPEEIEARKKLIEEREKQNSAL